MLQGAENFDSIYFKHASARDLKRMMGDEWEAYSRFTVVRNPWDWVVSNYEFNRGLHRPFTKGTRYDVSATVPEWAQSMTFEAWLQWWVTELEPSQLRLVASEDGTLLVQEVWRFEELGKCLREIRRRVGDWLPAETPHKTKSRSQRRGLEEYYTESTLKLVSDHFADDIRTFGYSFPGRGPTLPGD